MSDETSLVPVMLEFRDVARDQNLSIELSTPGVSWSMGNARAGEVGFSLNPMALGGSHSPYIHSLELADAVLAIQTAGKNTSIRGEGSSFSLAAFLRCCGEPQSIDGYCSVNVGATILVAFQGQQSIVWRRGPVSAILLNENKRFKSIRLMIRGLREEKSVVLKLESRSRLGRNLRWSLGAPVPGGRGFGVRAEDGVAGPSKILLCESTLELTFGRSRVGPGADGELMLDLSVEIDDLPSQGENNVPLEADWLSLMADHDADVAVIAQVGTQLPRYVIDSFTPFSL